MLHTLRALIIERFRTQTDFALEAKVEPTRLSRIVRGYVKATAEERARVAELLGVDVETAFSEGTPRSRPAALAFDGRPAVRA